MRLVKLCLAASILAAGALNAAAVEITKPFEALEGARRDRIEMDKRMKREAIERRKQEEERRAQREAQRKRDAAAAKAAQSARPSSSPPVPSQPATGPSQSAPSGPTGAAPE